MSITLLDGILIVVMLISALLAMIRGFVREVLSIAAWVAAAAAAFFLYDDVLPFVQPHISQKQLALVVSAASGGFATAALPSLLLANPADAFRLYNLAAAQAGGAAGGMGGAAASIPLWQSALSLSLWPLLALGLAIASFRKVTP